jgi:hypothetical protein
VWHRSILVRLTILSFFFYNIFLLYIHVVSFCKLKMIEHACELVCRNLKVTCFRQQIHCTYSNIHLVIWHISSPVLTSTTVAYYTTALLGTVLLFVLLVLLTTTHHRSPSIFARCTITSHLHLLRADKVKPHPHQCMQRPNPSAP